MTTTPLPDAFNRIVAIQKEAVAGSDAFPVAVATSERLPYWTNRYGGMTGSLDSQDFYLMTHRIDMALHLAYMTEDYFTQAEQGLYVQIQAVLAYFFARIRLNSTAYPSTMADIDPRGALITAVGPYAPIDWSGIGAKTVGIVFTIEVPILEQINQAY